jgi:hypothetical protein
MGFMGVFNPTLEEFLDRVRTSESTLQEAFTNEAIKAIYTTLHVHAINALAKNNSVSNVDNLLYLLTKDKTSVEKYLMISIFFSLI